ncbi:NAD(P)-dependent oxidoreductase [Haloechinothrix sp. LS1_15]|uniref:NAD(P)-dependent oxidoreductase n=1 Tax=Haloechinothrix sp. LS1_15 TaxID=2652248 RepID=UPI002947775C|nr:NAD(P)-dependent oxidoreductase [Haloechinothrix sp. LS1_15]MDV6014047.1 hydroxyacid dehydrogenase [Haloechinothrix sp. LS1_15]
MRVLIADTFPDTYRRLLGDRGYDCRYQPDLTTADLPEHLGEVDALIVRSTAVDAAAIEAAGTLGVIIRAGAGTNTIDCRAATGAGIPVCNVPGRNAEAVAELAFGLLLALDRRIPDAVAELRHGHWNKKWYAQATGIKGRDIGVVGLGQIGLAFAERAAAFGAQVHGIASSDRPAHARERIDAIGIDLEPDLASLAERCDVLSLHVPATPRTRGMIDRELLARVRPGTIILNTARGELIDEDALLEAMDAKGVRAGLDVFAGEPQGTTGTIDSRLARHPHVYGTHHIGASTEQAQHAIAAEVVTMLDTIAHGTVPHCVNPEVTGPAGTRPRYAMAAS